MEIAKGIWGICGIIGWIYFFLSIKPSGGTEWFLWLLLFVPCFVGGPLSIIVVAICNKIDPLTRP